MRLNLPNTLTLLRIFLVPLLVVVLLTPPWTTNWIRDQLSEQDALRWIGDLSLWLARWRELVAVAIFLTAAATDWLDGYLARSRNQVTTLGKLLDPIADKLLTVSAFISLVELHLAPAWMVVVIVGREFILSAIRSIAATRGVIIAASRWGKYKTVAQVVAITLLILTKYVERWVNYVNLGNAALWVVMLLAVGSMLHYIHHFVKGIEFGAEISKPPHPISHIRRHLLRGLILVLPLLITVWLLSVLFNVINTKVTPLIRQVLIWVGIPNLELWFARLGIPIIGLLTTVAFIYLLGLLGGNLGGRRLVAAGESYILRIPIVKGIYGSARQLLDAFNLGDRRHFSRVVVVQYPREGLWTVGFVTREIVHRLGPSPESAVRLVPVFLPTTPNPTSGWMVLVPESDLVELDMTIEDGLKMVVSGGIVSPDDLGSVVSRWPVAGQVAVPE